MIVTPISDKLVNVSISTLPNGFFDKENIITFFNVDKGSLQSLKFSHVQVLNTVFKDIHIYCNDDETPKVYVRVDGQWYLETFEKFLNILFSIYGEFFTPSQKAKLTNSFRDNHNLLINNLFPYQLNTVDKSLVDVVRKELTPMQYSATEQEVAPPTVQFTPKTAAPMASLFADQTYSDDSLQSLLDSIKKATPVKKFSWELKEGKVTRREQV
jgi:hypothetical protein